MPTSPFDQPPTPPLFVRLVAGIFGLIGITVLVFLWAAPFDEFGSPPLFFRIFGSLIASVFVIVGVSGAFGRGMAAGQPRNPPFPGGTPPAPSAARGYQCTSCGATLGANADVSPSGDVKCQFCGRWFNIHKA